MILAPVVIKQKETPTERENSDETSRVAGFRAAYVFDVEQTDGQPLPPFAKTTGDAKDYGEKLRMIAGSRGISVEYDRSIAPAMGTSSGGRIHLMPDMEPAEEFSVLAHELAHEMLHHGPDAPRLSKLERETQAEAIAFVVCRGVGLETNNAAADYIALYNGDKKTLVESLTVIQQTAASILDDLGQERHVTEPASTLSPDTGTSTPGPSDSKAEAARQEPPRPAEQDSDLER